jgi:two-component sensor histidine kinase
MALHDLATNAAKYGALSRAEGRLVLSWDRDPATGDLRLAWEERGGPPVRDPPERRGFGSSLIAATLRGQLGGTEDRRWDPAGLRCEITIPARHLREAAPDPGRRAAPRPGGGRLRRLPSAAPRTAAAPSARR